MENSLIDSVIHEIQLAFDLTTKLQSLVEIGNYGDTVGELARVLSEEVLQTCNATLSVLKSRKTNVKVETSCAMEFGSQDRSPLDVPVTRGLRKNYERRYVTATPYNDAHQWRKYGEKMIKGCIFKRSYYKCTYSDDQRCQARKQVQQHSGDPYLFLVIYKREHTCNSLSTTDDVQHMMQGCQTANLVQLQSYNDMPFFLVRSDGEHTCNTSFPFTDHITAETPPVEPFLLHFDSKDREMEQHMYTSSCMNTTRKNITEGNINRQSENFCTSSSKHVASADRTFLESMEPLQPSLSAVLGIEDDVVLSEVSSPSSIELVMDFLGFDVLDME